MAITPPGLFSLLSVPQQANNFIALQSAKLSAGTASNSITFTNIPSANRVTFKITNTGSVGAYLASGPSAALAVISTSVPSPVDGSGAVSNCDYIGAGAILTQDYIGGTIVLAGITASGTAPLEISIGTGQ